MGDGVAPKEILLIEDDLSLAELIRLRLSSAGFQVHLAGEGQPGLKQAAEHRPDLVILDLMLPDMSGYDVCRELRRMYHRWQLPILMLTALGRPVDELRGFAHGADAYLTKPYEPDELLSTIATLLSETPTS
ncbi:MAG: hypothetical protein COV75_02965 [Candidatus Omnitrophica bacterium CG11_big_fil_rev_8_21_14_0_20_63_9]|nr:MAG: hypothetical protein COV75_02965 [Candidatus Omnitrophica bacterium CG11_big_fil_rev_8_21_14_0_20_63_9]